MRLALMGFIKNTNHRLPTTDQPTTYHLLTNPPTGFHQLS